MTRSDKLQKQKQKQKRSETSALAEVAVEVEVEGEVEGEKRRNHLASSGRGSERPKRNEGFGQVEPPPLRR